MRWASYGLWSRTPIAPFSPRKTTFFNRGVRGYWLNLFNLIPVGQLDGGHVVQAISPWLWLPGFGIALWLALTNGHFIIWLIVILAVPRAISLFRPRTDVVQSFYSVPGPQRWRFAIEYFGLIAFLVYIMDLADRSLSQFKGFTE